jgi:hypothetical protein
MSTLTKCGLWLLAAAALAPGPLAAQLTINLQGAPPSTPVSAIVGGAKQVIGQTGAGGSVVLNANAMNIGKGTRVDVKVKTQGGQSEVVLVPAGEVDPDCQDPQRRNDPDCRVVGYLTWGQTAAVTLSLGGAVPTMTSTAPAAVTTPGKLRLGVTLDVNWYHGFSSVVGDQPDIQTATGDDTPIGGGAFLEWQPTPRPWYVGLGVRYNRHAVTQTFASGNPLIPTATSGRVSALFVDSYAGVQLPWKNTTITFAGGATLSYDHLDLTSEYGSVSRTENRTHTGFKANFGTGLVLPLSGGFSARFGLDYTTAFQGGDADAHLRFGGGLQYRLRARF